MANKRLIQNVVNRFAVERSAVRLPPHCRSFGRCELGHCRSLAPLAGRYKCQSGGTGIPVCRPAVSEKKETGKNACPTSRLVCGHRLRSPIRERRLQRMQLPQSTPQLTPIGNRVLLSPPNRIEGHSWGNKCRFSRAKRFTFFAIWRATIVKCGWTRTANATRNV